MRARNLFLMVFLLGVTVLFLGESVNAEEYLFEEIGDSVTVCDGKILTLAEIKSEYVMIGVDGPVYGIFNEERYINHNLMIGLIERTSPTKISVRCVDTRYEDGDAYTVPCSAGWSAKDCKATNPDWKWGFDGLTTDYVELYIKSDFNVNGDEDNPVGVGECYTFPCGKAGICFDGLIADDKEEYIIEYEADVDLSNALGPIYSSEEVIYIHTSVVDGLEVESDNIIGIFTDEATSKIWLHIDNIIPTNLNVIYENEDNDMVLAGQISTVGRIENVNFARVTYEKTKENNIEFDLSGSTAFDNDLLLTLDIIDDNYDIKNGEDDLYVRFGHDATEFKGLGVLYGRTDPDDLSYGYDNDKLSVAIKRGNHRTRYGIVINDPKSNSAIDRVSLAVPRDNVLTWISYVDYDGHLAGRVTTALGSSVAEIAHSCDGGEEFCEHVGIGSGLKVVTSLSSRDDDYEDRVYLEVSDRSIEFILSKNTELVRGERIDFQGVSFDLVDFGDGWITVSDISICGCDECNPEEYPKCAEDENSVLRCEADEMGCYKKVTSLQDICDYKCVGGECIPEGPKCNIDHLNLFPLLPLVQDKIDFAWTADGKNMDTLDILYTTPPLNNEYAEWSYLESTSNSGSYEADISQLTPGMYSFAVEASNDANLCSWDKAHAVSNWVLVTSTTGGGTMPGAETECDDYLDNDADGQIDCYDSDCNQWYEEHDGVACEDSSVCADNQWCNLAGCCIVANEYVDYTCGDELDNDHDGRVDCWDEDCEGAPNCGFAPSFSDFNNNMLYTLIGAIVLVAIGGYWYYSKPKAKKSKKRRK